MDTPHALIVGGTAGVGRVLARRFAGRNYRVSALGRRPPPEPPAPEAGAGAGSGAPVGGLADGLPGVHGCVADLLDLPAAREAVARCLAARGKLRHLVFCQRYRGGGDPWAGEMRVSLDATKTLIDLCADQFDGARECGIVIVTSAGGRFVLAEQPPSYHAAKAALRQLARYYAVLLGPRGIRVNAVCPDVFLKDESRQAYEHKPELHRLRALYESATPLGRMGTAEDVADVAEFLCGPQASFVTGQEIVVDGGLSLAGHAAVARQAARLDGVKITR